jgi:diguanylate cyclase (GGDEF)-like protein
MDRDGNSPGSRWTEWTGRPGPNGNSALLRSFAEAMGADAGWLVGGGEAPASIAAWDPDGLGEPPMWLGGRFMQRLLESGRLTAVFDAVGGSRTIDTDRAVGNRRIRFAVGGPVSGPDGRGAAICAGFIAEGTKSLPSMLWTTEQFAAVAALELQDAGGFARLVAGADSDALTGCLTYRGLIDAMDTEIDRSERRGHPLSCCFIDLDDFKDVNGRKGHVFGNRVLSAVGGALRTSIRAYDVVGRFGGDEFVVLLPETSERDAHSLVERLHQAVCDAASGAAGMPIDAAFGEAQWRQGMSTEDLLDAADRGMRGSKRMARSVAGNGRPG